MQQNHRPQTLVHLEISLDQRDNVLVEFQYAVSLAAYEAGQMQCLLLAMTAQQARQVADDLRMAAGQSRQSDDPGHA